MKSELQVLVNGGIIAMYPHYDGTTSAIIETVHSILHSEEKVDGILEHYCYQFASSLQGRKQASRKYYGNRKNPPILISELLKMVAMQLPMSYYSESMWVFDLNFDINEIGRSSCEIIFQNDRKFIIPLSKHSIMMRKFKAMDLLNKSTLIGKGKGFHKDDDT